MQNFVCRRPLKPLVLQRHEREWRFPGICMTLCLMGTVLILFWWGYRNIYRAGTPDVTVSRMSLLGARNDRREFCVLEFPSCSSPLSGSCEDITETRRCLMPCGWAIWIDQLTLSLCPTPAICPLKGPLPSSSTVLYFWGSPQLYGSLIITVSKLQCVTQPLPPL